MKKAKTFRSLLALVTALLLMMSSSVFAAADLSNVLVVGDTALDVEYLFNQKAAAEAKANALLNEDGSNAFYRLEGDTNFTSVFGGTQVSEATGLAAIKKYVSPTGAEEAVGEQPPVELEVVSVSAITGNVIEVTFEGMEPIEITLETALVNGQTEVTFTYEGVEYTATLSEAWTDAAIAAVNEASNYLTMQTALENEALGLELGAYANFTDTEKETVAAAVLAARPATGYVDLAAIQAAFDAEVSTIVQDAFDTAFAAINAVALNDAGQMKAALDANFAVLDLQGLGVEYEDLAVAQKTAVANAVFVIREALPAPTAENDRNEDAVAGKFYDKAELEAAFEDETAMPAAALAELNAASDADTVLAAFELKSLALVFPAEYVSMSDEDKAAVAGAVYGAIGGGFADLAAAQVALDDAVLAQIQANEDAAKAAAALAAVNNAKTAVEMRLALESNNFATFNPAGNFTDGTYNSTQKTWLAKEIIEAREALEAGRAIDTESSLAGVIFNETELQTIFDEAVTSIDTRIAAIATAEASLAAIPDPAAYQLNDARDGIDVDDQDTPLGTEVTDARADVDAAVAAGATEAELVGVATLIAAEAKVEEFAAEINVIAAVNAVNAANGNASDIRIALSAEELGLEAYNALSLSGKNAVAQAIDTVLDELEAYNAETNPDRNENAVANEFYDLAELEAAVAEAIANL